jgi:hypothetical protein
MKVQAFCADSIPAVETGIQDFIKSGHTPTLAIVFASVAHDLESVRQVFMSHGIKLFGGSSSGEIMDDGAYEESLACMLLEVPPAAFQVNSFAAEGQTSFQLGHQVGLWAAEAFEKPAIMLLSAGLQADGEQIVLGVIAAIGYQAPLFGGLAGDDLRMQGSYVFGSSQVISEGLVAVAFDQNQVELSGTTVSGWRKIGTPKTITHSEGNLVYSIDNQPTLDVYAKYLNLPIDSITALAGEYPLLVMRDNEAFVLRSAMVINEDKSMVYAGSVPQDAKVFFSMPPGSEIIDRAVENVAEFQGMYPDTSAVVMVSCKARHLALGPLVEDEIAAIYNIWKQPMVGFFAYGEIGPNKVGNCDFHNDTISLVLLRAKDAAAN